jgi:hypothetical protein
MKKLTGRIANLGKYAHAAKGSAKVSTTPKQKRGTVRSIANEMKHITKKGY